MHRFFWLTFICFVGFSTSSTNSQELERDEVSSISGSIDQVVSGGQWSHDNVEGKYRAVVAVSGYEHVIYRLHLQWLRDDSELRGYRVLRTLPVEEINNRFGAIVLTSMKVPNVILGTATSRADGRAYQFSITVNAKGTYEVKIESD